MDYTFFDCVLSVSETTGMELLKFDKPFRVPRHVALDPDMCSDIYTNYSFAEAISTQRWKNEDGFVVPVDPRAKVVDLIRSRARSARESKNRFYNYALGDNNWQYFCTWTFADEQVRSDKDLLYATYNKFISVLRKKNPDVKALATYEEFENGGYHMHALLGNCLLRLTPAINPHDGQFIYSEFGNQIFNCIDWPHGFSTVACIDPKSEKQQVVNYLGKYLTKKCPAPYRCKRFFHTVNLDCRDIYMLNGGSLNEPLIRALIAYKGELADESGFDTVKNICAAFDMEQVKTTNTLSVYRSKESIRGYLDYCPEAFSLSSATVREREKREKREKLKSG